MKMRVGENFFATLEYTLIFSALTLCIEIISPKFFVDNSAHRMQSCFRQAYGRYEREAHRERFSSKSVAICKTISTGCFDTAVGGCGDG